MNKKEVILPFGKIIYQSEYGQGITSDTAFIVEEILNLHKESDIKLLELGSGNGIISLMIGWHRKYWNIIGIEIQKHLVELAKSNAELLQMQNVTFVQKDLNRFAGNEKFDIIVSNPPFYQKNQGRISPNKERAISRHEIKTDMKSILLCIDRNLTDKGDAYLIYPELRLNEFEKEIKNIDLKTISKKIISQVSKNILLHIKRG